jgi:hypothetical protein
MLVLGASLQLLVERLAGQLVRREAAPRQGLYSYRLGR